MKEATFAPLYAAMFPALSDIAREHGYALCIHGSLQKDLDLLAVPWVEDAKSPDDLFDAIATRMNMMHGTFPSCIDSVWTAMPHGRMSRSLFIGFGAYVDFGVMPKRC